MKRVLWTAVLILMLFTVLFSQQSDEIERTNPNNLIPVIRPNGGDFSTPQTVTISAATGRIFYTLNGRAPTTSSQLYTSPITVDRNASLSVRVFADDDVIGEVVIANFGFTAQPPSFSPRGGSYTETQNIRITSPTPDVEIRYTTDGSEPNRRSSLYADRVIINGNADLRIRSFKDGWHASETVGDKFSFLLRDPSISPSGGTFTDTRQVTVTPPNPDVQIRYTVDGSEPTDRSALYTSPISLDGNTELKVRAFKAGWIPSGTITGTYSFSLPKPSVTPQGGSYIRSQSVSMDVPISGVELRYTTDGSQPNESSLLYSSSILIDRLTDLKVKAFRRNWTPSETVSENYVFTAARPQISLSSGEYDQPQPVSISSESDNVRILYTTDGTQPTTSSILYQEPIHIDREVNLRVRAFREGWNTSDENSARYSFRAANPVFSPKGDTYNLAQRINLSSPSQGTTIYYTVDGSAPTQNSIAYKEPVNVTTNITIRAFAARDGWTSSQPITEQYVIQMAMVLVPSGSFIPLEGTEAVINRSYHIGTYPVTQEQWTSVMGNNPSLHEVHYGNNHPVEWVSWYEALKFSNLMSIRDGYQPVYSINATTNPEMWGPVPAIPDSAWCAVVYNHNANGYRLPTSAEWEYAARSAGRDNFLYAGGNNIEDFLWYHGNADGTTQPVGTKLPNSLGLYDMTGNVWEWCWDTVGEGTKHETDAQTTPRRTNRILRGGSFVSSPATCSISSVFNLRPHQSYPSRGLRLVRNAGQE